ncbi:hypothetical protein LPICM17_550008 [Lactococcus piscium]|nr:hypothetical protein LPICM17_550008 [Lactococcus piscium]
MGMGKNLLHILLLSLLEIYNSKKTKGFNASYIFGFSFFIILHFKTNNVLLFIFRFSNTNYISISFYGCLLPRYTCLLLH